MTRRLILLALAPVLLAACGSPGSGAGPTQYSAPTPVASSTPSPDAVATQAPSSAPAATPVPAPPTPAVSPSVLVAQNANLGAILVDPQGRTLYYFVPERGGRIVCAGQCTNVWPPAFAHSMSPSAGAGAPGQLGVIARVGGEQLTYNRWPVYSFAGDAQSGQTNGQGVFGFGGKWFVATPGLQP